MRENWRLGLEEERRRRRLGWKGRLLETNWRSENNANNANNSNSVFV